MAIIIKSEIDNFRRAGMAHSKESVTHPAGTFTAAQIKQLQAEPRLLVTVTEDDPADQNNAPQGPLDGECLSGLVTHIAGLDKNNPALWKQDGTPKASAFPKNTTEEERAAAWGAYLLSTDFIGSEENGDITENGSGE